MSVAGAPRIFAPGRISGPGGDGAPAFLPDGWSAPRELPESVNISGQIFRPSIARNGNLYFISRESPKQKFRLYRSVLRDGTYQPAEALSFSDGSTLDVDPEIAPDESFVLFASAGREPFHDDHEHLYIVFRKGEGWGSVNPLRYQGDDWPGSTTDDDPRLSRDGRVLYFSSDRTPPFHYPMDAAAVREGLSRANIWDTGNTNVWELDFTPAMFLPQ